MAEDLLRKGGANVWDSGRTASDQSIYVPYDGPPLASRLRYFWRVRVWDAQGQPSPWSEATWWEMGLLEPNQWRAQWILRRSSSQQGQPQPCPHFRVQFPLRGQITRARLYATARGIYRLHVNGQVVSEDTFAPGWTDYRRRLLVQTYDVGSLLVDGDNAIGAIVGDGWYCGHVAHFPRGHYGKVPAFLAQLIVEHADGRMQVIATGPEWTTKDGPIRSADLIQGEAYDARLALPGWDSPEPASTGWEPVGVEPVDLSLLVPSCRIPVCRTPLAPQAVSAISGGWLVDFGQNCTGRLVLSPGPVPAGTVYTLRHAEMLQPDGAIYTANLRTAAATDRYTTSGHPAEQYEPTFTFHGFRYAEIVADQPVSQPAVSAVALSSDLRQTGTFACSNPMVNQLWQNILWTLRNNYLEVPTDCPQRDERLGWLGDAQVFIRTACYACDVLPFMTRWLGEVASAQRPDGAYPDVAPDVGLGAGNAGWADAGVIIPWVLYRVYGDRRILERHYESMTRWIDWQLAHSKGLIRPEEGFGDWLSLVGGTSLSFIGTAYFAHSADLMARIAAVLGRRDDAQRFQMLYEQIRIAFQMAFVAPDGTVGGGTQTCYTLALRFGLLPEDLRPAAARRLVNDIEQRNGHLTTGLLGTAHLLPTLADHGYLETAYTLLQQETFPSWGYMIRQGATTIWERWDGWTKEKGFQDPSMNSFNHYGLGSVGAWLFTHVAGIDCSPLRPGYGEVRIRPQPGGGLVYACATYDSVRGLIRSEWRQERTGLSLVVCVPPNTRAQVYIPALALDRVTEQGRPLTENSDFGWPRFDGAFASAYVGSGEYAFFSEGYVCE